MLDNEPEWGRYEELRPDDLQRIVAATPVVYWPLGLLEHHGWHLPVGFDGLKAERICCRMARRIGGLVLPVMWWGGGGGHGGFQWTLYQPMAAPLQVAQNTLPKLISFGFRAIVLLAGHYPWRGVLQEVLPPLQEEKPEVLFVSGTEMELGRPDVSLPGDHAARWETAYGLALLPELVDMAALRDGRPESEAWPEQGPPPEAARNKGVRFDPGAALFAQAGEDARKADKQEAARLVDALVEAVAGRVERHLAAL